MPFAAAAQGFEFDFPAGSILPNYDRVNIGQMEALEGNAYVARSHDAGSNWYNPAGLVLSEKSALNATANAYEITHFTLQGLKESGGSTRFSPLGTFFGGVIGAPILETDRVRLGFSYTRPLSWTPSPLEGEINAQLAGSTEKFLYSSYCTFVSDIPGIAVGWRATSRLRFGAGVADAITSLHQEQSISDRLQNATSATTLLHSLQSDASQHDVLLNGGVQVDLSDRFVFGALVASPGIRVLGSGRITYQKTLFSGTGTSDLSFRDEDVDFEYKIPFRVTAGLGARFTRAEVELDLKYHAAEDPYTLFSSSVPAQLVITGASGVPTTTTAAFRPAEERARSVYNVSLGGRYMLREKLGLHVGFFSDTSPVDDEATSLFRKVDLIGASTGVSFAFGRLSGAVGVTGSWGESDDRQIGPSLGGQTAQTRINVQSYNLMYALSYEF
jgi:hypothetical protein